MLNFKELFEAKKSTEATELTYDEYKMLHKKMTKVELAKYKKFAKQLRDEETKIEQDKLSQTVLAARKKIIGR